MTPSETAWSSAGAATSDCTVTVDLGGRAYDIEIGSGLLGDIGPKLALLTKSHNVVLVADASVEALYGAVVRRSLSEAGFSATWISIESGEASKSFATLHTVLDRMLDIPVTRGTPVIALGGGVVGDLGGFAAAVALRGLPYMQVPTTLLSQVDSAVGGKTGINAAQGKNLVGAFYQPIAVLSDTDVLNSLSDREMRAGYAEIVKYGALGDAAFFDWLCANGKAVLARDAAALAHAIATSCKAKAQIVAEDEREADRRALLNLGHTFGHALEAECGYDGRLLHGEGVAIGMCLASKLSVSLGYCPPEHAQRLQSHLAEVGLPVDMCSIEGFSGTPERLIEHMRHDKKAGENELVFVLMNGIGEAFISRDVPIEAVRAVLIG